MGPHHLLKNPGRKLTEYLAKQNDHFTSSTRLLKVFTLLRAIYNCITFKPIDNNRYINKLKSIIIFFLYLQRPNSVQNLSIY